MDNPTTIRVLAHPGNPRRTSSGSTSSSTREVLHIRQDDAIAATRAPQAGQWRGSSEGRETLGSWAISVIVIRQAAGGMIAQK